MKKSMKIALIIAAVLMFAGAVCMLISLHSVNYDFRKLYTVEYITEQVTVEGDCGGITEIELDEGFLDVTFHLSDDEFCRIEYPAVKNVDRRYYLENNGACLKNAVADNRPWYERFNFTVGELPAVKIYLPKDSYNRLKIKTASGDVCINNDIQFNNCLIETSSGDIEFSLSHSDYADLKSQSGDITVKNVSKSFVMIYNQSGDIQIGNSVFRNLGTKTSSGDITAENIQSQGYMNFNTVSGNIHMGRIYCQKLYVNSVSGDVDFDGINSDQDINIKTISGDVNGVFKYHWHVTAKTDSGSVRIPECEEYTKNQCSVETVSGDINIEAPQ